MSRRRHSKNFAVIKKRRSLVSPAGAASAGELGACSLARHLPARLPRRAVMVGRARSPGVDSQLDSRGGGGWRLAETVPGGRSGAGEVASGGPPEDHFSSASIRCLVWAPSATPDSYGLAPQDVRGSPGSPASRSRRLRPRVETASPWIGRGSWLAGRSGLTGRGVLRDRARGHPVIAEHDIGSTPTDDGAHHARDHVERGAAGSLQPRRRLARVRLSARGSRSVLERTHAIAMCHAAGAA